jgi:hypothetical protein
MERLKVTATKDTPEITLDKGTGTFEIKGRSFPEDAYPLFSKVMNWFNDYAHNPNPQTKFVLNLEYFNTASSRVFMEMFQILKEIPGVEVIWCFADGDDDMFEAGEQFSQVIEMPFTLRRT